MAGDDTVRLTYTELAEMRGISLASARRMVHRHKWPKQIGNDGLSRIAVPVEFVTRPASASSNDPDDVVDGAADDVIPGALIDAASVQVIAFDEAAAAFAKITTDAINGATRDAVMTLQEAITSLRVELQGHRERADRADGRAQEAENRAQAAESRMRDLQEQLQTEMIEHRRVVGLLTEQLAARRFWWPWHRRS